LQQQLKARGVSPTRYDLNGARLIGGVSLSVEENMWTVSEFVHGLIVSKKWFSSEHLACTNVLLTLESTLDLCDEKKPDYPPILPGNTLKDLGSALTHAGVRKTAYNLHGEAGDEKLTLAQDGDGRWTVYFCERGERSWQTWFPLKSDAYAFIWKTLVRPPTDKPH
jgi:hypothetical protein